MKSQKRQEYKHEPKSKEYLIALTNSINYCELVNTEDKSYKKLLKWIIDYGKHPEKDSDISLPDLKVISKVAEVPYSSIAKQLKDIYNDIYDLSDTNPDRFAKENQKVYALAFNYLGCYGFFNMGLAETPREGERFNFSFIKPKVGSDHFWVKTVEHDIHNGKHMVTIWVNHEHPNAYLNLLKEKAYLNNQIDWHEYYGHLNYDAEKRLVNLYRNL